jgi:hypothetical protein
VDIIEKLQVPGLILAGIVIWRLFVLLESRDRWYDKLLVELTSQGQTLSRVAAILDLICKRGGHSK